MSMHWKPEANAKPVVLGKSRIRRDPVQLQPQAPIRKTIRRTNEQEMWFGVTGVLLITAAIVAATVGISIATYTRFDPVAAAQERRFSQCYNAVGPNCVVSGDTISISGAKVQIAGLDAPGIQAARCDSERSQGIQAALRLADLLNSGRVTVSGTFRDRAGREVRKVRVKDRDVADAMIDAGVAHAYGDAPRNWCR